MYEKNLENKNDDLDDYNTVEVGAEPCEDDYPNLSIKIEKAQYSLFELKRQFKKGKICIDPAFQRNDVWSKRQKSELIESVIMGIPLPLIYIAEDERGKLIVVDGRQRLTTFFDFMDNKFRLSDLKILPQVNGMSMQDLEKSDVYSQYVSIIEDTQLVVQIIKYPTKDRVIFDIFDRVNRGGTPLNKQEMRNALYQGNATSFLNKMSETDCFLKATGGKISTVHMKDKYIILRAVCFYLWMNGELTDKNNKKVEYRSDMEEFLGSGMQFLNRASAEKLRELEELFKSTMEFSYNCMGEDGYRIPSKEGKKRPISMTLFETLFYFFTLVYKDKNYNNSEKAVKELLGDAEYLRSLQHSVDSSVNVNLRFAKVRNKFREIYHVESATNQRI